MSSDVDTDMVKRALAATDFADTPRSRRWMRAALDAALAPEARAADRIEAQAAEIARLREALQEITDRITMTSPRVKRARSALSKVKP